MLCICAPIRCFGRRSVADSRVGPNSSSGEMGTEADSLICALHLMGHNIERKMLEYLDAKPRNTKFSGCAERNVKVQKFPLKLNIRVTCSTAPKFGAHQLHDQALCTSRRPHTTMAVSMLRRFLMPYIRIPISIAAPKAVSKPSLIRQFSSTPTAFATYNQVIKVDLPHCPSSPINVFSILIPH